jgi:hypothetical protein
VLIREHGSLGHDGVVPAELELRLEPLLERGQAQLVEPCDLLLQERLEGEIRERRSAPQRERVP